ncbi:MULTISPECIES: hypothetical protein [unclassified Brevundimonas]
MDQQDILILRECLSSLEAGAAWPAGRTPLPHQIYTPTRHRNVLDLNRSIVVGNRGVGKTFWSHALHSVAGREVAAQAYRLPALRNVTAQFGFAGSISDGLTPSQAVLSHAMETVPDPLVVWKAVLIRILLGTHGNQPPGALVDVASWLQSHPEEGERTIRMADNARPGPLLVMFDALDTLANDWSQIRLRTIGLLQLALLAKGLRNVKLKIFMRPDQLEDAFTFPDASKLRAERVELQWGPQDLYGLLMFHIMRDAQAQPSLVKLLNDVSPGVVTSTGDIQDQFLNYETIQRSLFNRLAGEWMGKDRKQGATYSWLVQHLADANGETTPRGFLTAVRSAAQAATNEETVIDYKGLHQGVGIASENRVGDLQQDYWWIDYVSTGLAGLHTPLEKETLFQVWKENGVVDAIKRAAPNRGLEPVYISLRRWYENLPPETARLVRTDEDALLLTLQLVGVAEVRSNGKVNFPDIFRVAFGMKRRGGVPPRKR